MKNKGKLALIVAVSMGIMSLDFGYITVADDSFHYKNQFRSEIQDDIDKHTDISEMDVELVTDSYIYTGKECEPEVIVKHGSSVLVLNLDYELEYRDNINAGMASVIVKGIGSYSGDKILEFEILPKKLTDKEVSVDDSQVKAQYEFIGKDITPIIKLRYNDMNLNTMADFTVAYENNFYLGTAVIRIEGLDNYSGVIEKRFNIVKKAIANVTIRTGFENKTLYVNVNNGSRSMTRGKDYDYNVYIDAKGNITITLRGLGTEYTGTTTRTIKAEENPNRPVPTTAPSVQKVKIQKIKNVKGKKIKLSWKRISKVTGYHVRYAKNKKLITKAKIRKIKKNTSKYTTAKLKQNKKYYIQVRAYKVFNGKTYFGKWSKAKTVKVIK